MKVFILCGWLNPKLMHRVIQSYQCCLFQAEKNNQCLHYPSQVPFCSRYCGLKIFFCSSWSNVTVSLAISSELSAIDMNPPAWVCLVPLTCSSWLSIYSFTSGGQSLLKSKLYATSVSSETLQFRSSQQIPSPCAHTRVVSITHYSRKCIPLWYSVFVFFSAGSVLSLFPLPALPRAVPISLPVPVFQGISFGLFSFPRPISHASFFSAACAWVPLHLCVCLFLSTEEDEGKIEALNDRVGSSHRKQSLEGVCFCHYWALVAPMHWMLTHLAVRGWALENFDLWMVVASTKGAVLFHSVSIHHWWTLCDFSL